MKPRILVVAGTRPEIIKLAPVVRALQRRSEVRLSFVLSGQHYDYEMCKQFIEELELPEPDENLRIGSGTHAEQTAEMLVSYESIINEFEPKIVLAQGDTNTVAALGLTAIKLKIPFGHVEAGLRNYNRIMPEEINRSIAAVSAELHFAPTPQAALNLINEGIPPEKIFITGNTIVDTVLQNAGLARGKSKIIERLELRNPFAVATIHRAENVDKRSKLGEIVRGLNEIDSTQVVFPVHPRTEERLELFGLKEGLLKNDHVLPVKPLEYLDFLKLLSSAKLAITDSGGVQEEALTLKVPCLTVRDSTERPETVETGANRLVEVDSEKIKSSAETLIFNEDPNNIFDGKENPLGDGRAGVRIADIVVDKCLNDISIQSPNYRETGSAKFRLQEVTSELIGESVGEIQEKNPDSMITLVYDENGNPMFPEPKLELRKGWHIRIFGPNPDLNRG